MASRARDKAPPRRTAPRVARSAGSAALQKFGDRQVDIADRLGVHQSLVARWGTGERSPTASQRKLLRAQLGIPTAAWDTPVSPPQEFQSTPLNGTSFKVQTQRLFDETIRLRQMAEQSREDGDVRMYMKALREAAIQQTLLGKLLGVTTQISEERILRMPAFRNLVDRVLEAIAPWPDALRALIQTLEVLEEDSRPKHEG